MGGDMAGGSGGGMQPWGEGVTKAGACWCIWGSWDGGVAWGPGVLGLGKRVHPFPEGLPGPPCACTAVRAGVSISLS